MLVTILVSNSRLNLLIIDAGDWKTQTYVVEMKNDLAQIIIMQARTV